MHHFSFLFWLQAGTCTFEKLTYGVEPNGVKVTYNPMACVPPAVTLPDDPSIVAVGALGLKLTVGTRDVFGPENGKTYNALQFHIHSSSEHTVDGASFGAEMHIVHGQEGIDGSLIQDAFESIPIVNSLLTGMNDSRGVSCGG